MPLDYYRVLNPEKSLYMAEKSHPKQFGLDYFLISDSFNKSCGKLHC